MRYDMENNPIQWGNPASRPAYGHSQSRHGSKKRSQKLIDRAHGTGEPQGQFYDDIIIVEAERMTRKQPTFGQGGNLHLAEFNKPIGRVYHPDGNVTENVTKVLVVRRPDSTVKTSYPITDEYAQDLLNQ